MRKKIIRRAVSVLIAVSIAVAAMLWAQSGSSDHDEEGSLQGSFLATVHESGGRTFKALFTFTREGGLVETNFTPSLTSPFGPIAVSHGAWVRTGDHQFALTFLFLGQTPGDPNSSFVRTKVREQIRLDDAGNSYRGIAQVTVLNAQGNVIATPTGTTEATRIVAEPIDE